MDKITKKELKKHDWFVTKITMLGHALEKRRGAVLGVLGVLLVGGIGFTAFSFYCETQESKAQSMLASADGKLKEIRTKFDKSKMTPPVDPKAKDKPKEEPGPQPTGDLMVDYKEAVEGYKKVIETHPKTQAAVLASLSLGKLYYDHNKYDEMVVLLEPIQNRGRHPAIKALVLNQLATGLEAKGDCGKAVTFWERMANDAQMEFIKGTALVNAGLCYERLNQKDKAEASYKKAESLNDPEASKSAKKYLRYLKWNKKA